MKLDTEVRPVIVPHEVLVLVRTVYPSATEVVVDRLGNIWCRCENGTTKLGTCPFSVELADYIRRAYGEGTYRSSIYYSDAGSSQ